MATGRLVSLLLSGIALLVAGCNGLFYFPYRGVYARPSAPHSDVSIPTQDGLVLHGWLLPARGEPLGTIVQFHGNAGNLTSHFLALEWVTEHQLSLLVFDYRGYGSSPGRPSREGLDRDARAAIRFAQALPQGRWSSDLVLIGQSLGGAVLLSTYGRVERRERVRAVVVEGAFHSYDEIAASVLWNSGVLLPFAGFGYLLVSDTLAPAPHIANIAPTPLLVVHGTGDRVIPPGFGRAIYGLARSPRELWMVPGEAHLRAFRTDEQRARLLAYLQRL